MIYSFGIEDIECLAEFFDVMRTDLGKTEFFDRLLPIRCNLRAHAEMLISR